MTFFFLDGRLGDFFKDLSTIVIFSLIFSLVEGALILPAHVAHSKALSPDNKKGWLTRQFDSFMAGMRDRLYAPILRFSMNNRGTTLAIIFGVFIVTIGAFSGGVIRTTFFPEIESDNLTVELKLPAGTREDLTFNWLTHIEEATWAVNDELSDYFFDNEKEAILKVEKIVGPTSYEGRINITLLDGESRDSLKARRVSNAIREKAGTIYGAESVTYGGSSPFGKPVSISLVGNDYAQLNAATDRVREEMASLADLKDVVDNNQEGLREINITLKEKALFLGLNLQEIVSQVRQGFFGSEIQRLQRGRDEVRVWVRYEEGERSNISDLENMRIRFADGREFPLAEIANLDIKRGVISIRHLEGMREVKVEADVANEKVSATDITSRLRNTIVPGILNDYPDVRALYEGQNRENEKTAKSAPLVLIIVLLMMFFTIAMTFKSLGQTIIVFALIPFCIIGVGWGHWLLDQPISLFSNLGIVALIGILVNDALVFVTTYNKMIKEGTSQMEAIYETGLSRFRPIVLTSVTTIAGLAPLIFFEKSFQAQFLIPMAISVAFGLLLITIIILVMLPTLLIAANRIKVYALYAWEGTKPALESVEPALEGRKTSYLLWTSAAIWVLILFAGVMFGLYKIAAAII